jgi:hypothetical protein
MAARQMSAWNENDVGGVHPADDASLPLLSGSQHQAAPLLGCEHLHAQRAEPGQQHPRLFCLFEALPRLGQLPGQFESNCQKKHEKCAASHADHGEQGGEQGADVCGIFEELAVEVAAEAAQPPPHETARLVPRKRRKAVECVRARIVEAASLGKTLLVCHPIMATIHSILYADAALGCLQTKRSSRRDAALVLEGQRPEAEPTFGAEACLRIVVPEVGSIVEQHKFALADDNLVLFARMERRVIRAQSFKNGSDFNVVGQKVFWTPFQLPLPGRDLLCSATTAKENLGVYILGLFRARNCAVFKGCAGLGPCIPYNSTA